MCGLSWDGRALGSILVCVLGFLLRQSVLVRVTLLLLLPAGGIAWMVQGFSLGEWCLAVFLLVLLLLLDWMPARATKKVHADVD